MSLYLYSLLKPPCFRGGYQDYQDRSPTGDYGGGRGQDDFGHGGGRGQDSSSGFGNQGGFQQSGRKDSDDWGNNWNESGWSEPEPKKESNRLFELTLYYKTFMNDIYFSVKASKASKKSEAKKDKAAAEGLLIDFDGSEKKAAKKDDWDNDWEDDAWESLSKDD